MSNSTNILFYSNKCELSTATIAVLKGEGMISAFKLICVDDPKNKIPSSIKKIPTIIIPSMSKVLIADDIIKWISSLRSAKANADNKKNPIGFIMSEMGGISDMYAYTNIDAAPKHSYVSCNEMGNTQIYTAPENQMRLNVSTQQNHIKYIEQRRKQQDVSINESLALQIKQNNFSKHQEMDDMIIKIVENQQRQLFNA